MEVFRLSFKMQIIWRFDVLMTMVATIGRVVVAWILWSAIFEGKELVGGFTFEAMLSYYIVCSIISSIDFSSQISGEVSELIRGGKFSGHMVTPMNPMGFFSSMVAGESAFHLGFSIVAAIVCVFVFNINILLTADILRITLAVILILLGLCFMACYQYFIGILTFKFMEIGFFHHMQGSIIAFATGSLVPLSLLPTSIITVLRYLPFTHVVFTPAMLMTGQIGFGDGLFGLIVLLSWIVAMFLTAQYTYRRLRVKYDGVGI